MKGVAGDRGWILASISFDDIDSPSGGCTTHLTGLFLLRLSRLPGIRLADYPLLVRLNPGIPWKTRGNAATVVRILVDSEDRARDAFELAVSMASEYSSSWRGAGKAPGVAMALGEPWRSQRLRWLYRKGLTDVLTLDVVERAGKYGVTSSWGGKGAIGATASLAALAPGDAYSFELIAYRRPEVWGSRRCIRGDLAAAIEAGIPACTVNNYDPLAGIVTAAPAGPDPILAGFRGYCSEYLHLYAPILCEDPHFWILYRSNQHTDAHALPLQRLAPYSTGVVSGTVAGDPAEIPGGHVVVRIETSLGLVDAVFFRETGHMSSVARMLSPGDRVRILGTVRPYTPRGRPTIAVDKLVIEQATPLSTRLANPRCPKCGARLESAGSGILRCRRCKYQERYRKIEVPSYRRVSPGVYTPPMGRLRHLTAPPLSSSMIPRLEALPLSVPWDSVLSTNVNPPVNTPSSSSGAHQ